MCMNNWESHNFHVTSQCTKCFTSEQFKVQQGKDFMKWHINQGQDLTSHGGGLNTLASVMNTNRATCHCNQWPYTAYICEWRHSANEWAMTSKCCLVMACNITENKTSLFISHLFCNFQGTSTMQQKCEMWLKYLWLSMVTQSKTLQTMWARESWSKTNSEVWVCLDFFFFLKTEIRGEVVLGFTIGEETLNWCKQCKCDITVPAVVKTCTLQMKPCELCCTQRSKPCSPIDQGHWWVAGVLWGCELHSKAQA